MIKVSEKPWGILMHTAQKDMLLRVRRALGDSSFQLPPTEYRGECALLPGGAKLYRHRFSLDGLWNGWWGISGYNRDLNDVYSGADCLLGGCTIRLW